MHKRSKTVRFSSCIQNKWTSILYLLLELIIGFGRSILWVQHIDHNKIWYSSSFLAWNTFGELLFVLFCSIIRWSVGHGLLRSEVAQVFSPHRNRQKPSFCLSHHGTVWLWQDLWDTLVFLVVAHESLRWTVPQKSGIQILTFLPASWKNDSWWDFTGSVYTGKSEIWVWWTEYPGVSLALQGVKSCLHKERLSALSLVVQLA